MEIRLNELAQTNEVVRKIQDLKYSFTNGYELDLKALNVPTEAHEPTRAYAERLSKANVTEIIAAVFILWGPLLIGGGAFGNAEKWIFDSMQSALEKYSNFGLDICIVSYSRSNTCARRLER